MEGNLWLSIGLPIAMLIFQVVLGAVGTLAFFALQRHFTKQDEREAKQDKAIKQVEKDLADYKETAVAELFPRRDDYILQMSNLDGRVGKLTGEVGEIKGYLEGRRGQG